MAFVPPVPGYPRDRAISEAYVPRKYMANGELGYDSGTSRRSSLVPPRKTVENTLPSWFETGFPEFDARDRGEAQVQKYAADAPESSSARAAVCDTPAQERELLAKYECESLDASRFENDGVITREGKAGTKVVMRRVAKGPFNSTPDIRREITILSLVADPALPTLVEWLEVPDSIWTVKALRPYQTLSENIRSHGPFSDIMTKRALNQLFSGITSLFLAGFAHLRICPDTVCLDENQQIVITDLHLACAYGQEKVGNYYATTREKYGSDIYVAPEVFASLAYNARKAVMWSCGVLLYFMITGQTDRLSNLEHPSFDKLNTDTSTSSPDALPQQDNYTSAAAHHRKLSVAHAKSKIITYPQRFAVPSYARAIIPQMLMQDPMRRAELIEVATRVPKDYDDKGLRPVMELAWLDYKNHVGPYAGLHLGAGGGGLQSSASSIFSAASNVSNTLGSLLRKSHSRRRSEPVTSRFSRYA